ncbi:MAG: hypothetical protein AB7K52_14425 [Phycisphaerales bacterium]
MNTDHARVIAACMGLTGFAVAIIAGAGAGNELSVVLSRALLALFMCFLAGYGIGAAAQHAFAARVAELKRAAETPAEPEADASPAR